MNVNMDKGKMKKRKKQQICIKGLLCILCTVGTKLCFNDNVNIFSAYADTNDGFESTSILSNNSTDIILSSIDEELLMWTDLDPVSSHVKGNKKTFELTFYTSLNEENGWGPVTATGTPLADKMLLASNVYKAGTKIYLEGFGILTVEDTGGGSFNNPNRLDVYIPRNSGESDKDYYKRVNGYGRLHVEGYIVADN